VAGHERARTAIRAARGEFPQAPTGWSGRLLQRWILSGLRGARHVLCVSGKTAGDLKALIESSGKDSGETGKNCAELRVVWNPLNWSYRPGAALDGRPIRSRQAHRQRDASLGRICAMDRGGNRSRRGGVSVAIGRNTA